MELELNQLKKTIVDVISHTFKKYGEDTSLCEDLDFHISKIDILENTRAYIVKIPLPNSNSQWTNDALELYFVLENLYDGFIDWSFNLSNNQKILCVIVPKKQKKSYHFYEFITQLQKKENYISEKYLNNNDN